MRFILFRILALISLLISQYVEAGSPCGTYLYRASNVGDLATVKLLVANGANVNEVMKESCAGWTALMIASAEGHAPVVNYLLDRGADPNLKNASGRTALMFASRYGFNDITKALIIKKADLNAQDQEGLYALYGAIDKGHVSTVEILIASGASLKIRDKHGWGPVSYAVHGNHDKILALLLKAGGDANEKNLAGEVPLHWACLDGRISLVQLLLKHKANPNVQTAGVGNTPLIMASGKGFPEIVEMLIAAGADVNARNFNGASALDTARLARETDVEKVLLKAGAKG